MEPHTDFSKFGRLILVRKGWFIFAILVTMAAVGGYFYIKGPIYEAEAILLVEEFDRNPLSKFEEFEPRKQDLKTRLLLITSEPILIKTVQSLGLVEKFDVENERAAVGILKNNTMAEEKEFKTNVIGLRVKNRHPKLAAEIANSIVDSYIENDFENTYHLPKKLHDWLDENGFSPDGSEESFQRLLGSEFISTLPSIVKDPILQDLNNRKINTQLEIEQLSKQYIHPPTAAYEHTMMTTDQLIAERKEAILRSLYFGFQEGLVPSGLKVISHARTPESPIIGGQIKIAIVAAYASFLMTFIILALIEIRRDAIKTEEDLKSNFFLGYLPREEQLFNPRKISIRAQKSISMIWSSLFFCAHNSDDKCYLITSASPSEGKTSISVGLAQSIALSGKKTVLIDTDFRRNQIQRILKIHSDAPSLWDYLSGKRGVRNLAVKTGIKGLDVIPSGQPETAASEFFNPQKMEALIRSLKKNYDSVLVDSPPILLIPDTKLLAKMTDGVVMVVRYDQTKWRAYCTAIQQLSDMKVAVKGTIINAFDIRKEKSHYYSKYYAKSYAIENTNTPA